MAKPGDMIADVIIEGHAKVESAAIINQMRSVKNAPLEESLIREDIKNLYKLGYFSHISIYEQDHPSDQTTVLIVSVKEKPAIAKITFEGFKEVSEDDFSKSLSTKLYQIVNEATVVADVQLISKKYEEKGFYLAAVSYELKSLSETETEVIFRTQEQAKVLVGDIFLLGNSYFKESDLIDKFVLKPFTRSSAYGSASVYQSDKLMRDTEFLSYYYKDFGFSDVKVGKPIALLDTNSKFVRITFNIEEGVQYKVKSRVVSGDVGEDLYTSDKLVEKMSLKDGKLFRYSQFAKDIESLVDKYGDLGYAFVDVNPLTHFDKEKQTVEIDYKITKGQKIYFGGMFIIGNTKTRDNVIRREMKIADSELYSGTKLSQSKQDISRLGFFDEVQIIKERDENIDDVMHLKFKVKEKPTGQLQAAIGITPPSSDTKASGFGQGRYEERNQSGRGWSTNLALKYSSIENYEITTGFYDPRLQDSLWSLGLDYSYEMRLTPYTSSVEIPEKRQSISLSLGRDLFELIRGFITLKHSKIDQKKKVYIFDNYVAGGSKNTLYLSLSRRDLDNYIDPTAGTSLTLRQGFTGSILGGDYQYMESSALGEWYIPLDFSDDYRTYFKLNSTVSRLWSLAGKPIPFSERYKLGGVNNLRGFESWEIGPKERRGRSPQGTVIVENRGGNKELVFQGEYFLPLIPQAGIKFLFFADAGQAFNENENYSFSNLEYDVGFGFRWITPIAPFRFEWAAPYRKETNDFGNLKFMINIGY